MRWHVGRLRAGRPSGSLVASPGTWRFGTMRMRLMACPSRDGMLDCNACSVLNANLGCGFNRLPSSLVSVRVRERKKDVMIARRSESRLSLGRSPFGVATSQGSSPWWVFVAHRSEVQNDMPSPSRLGAPFDRVIAGSNVMRLFFVDFSPCRVTRPRSSCPRAGHRSAGTRPSISWHPPRPSTPRHRQVAACRLTGTCCSSPCPLCRQGARRL